MIDSEDYFYSCGHSTLPWTTCRPRTILESQPYDPLPFNFNGRYHLNRPRDTTFAPPDEIPTSQIAYTAVYHYRAFPGLSGPLDLPIQDCAR